MSSDTSTAVEAPFQPVLKDAREHRRLHRTGFPSPLDTDPELAAFAAACLDTMTFAQTAAAITARFPEGRRTSMSSLHRWWHRQRRIAQSAATA
jgi:hypothetical protein